jgi:dTDP-glucose 4,6-dehydratase
MFNHNDFFIDIDDLEFISIEGEPIFVKLKGQNILIIGATSFVGMWMTESILYADQKFKLGLSITIISRNYKKTIERYGKFISSGKIKPIYKSIQDVNSEELSNIQQVVNLATLTDNYSGDSQLLGNLKMFENFWNILNKQSVQNILFTSSGAVYGKNAEKLSYLKETEKSDLNNYYKNLGYGLGKITSEFLGFEWSRRDSLNFKVARLFSFSGAFLPLSNNYIIGNFINNVIHNEPLLIKNPGKVYRSFLYGADMALWLWKILLDGDNTVYNVGSDKEITTIELANVVSNLYNNELKVIISQDNEGNDESYVPNIDKIKKELNVEIKYDLKLSLNKMINWYKKKHYYEKSI